MADYPNVSCSSSENERMPVDLSSPSLSSSSLFSAFHSQPTADDLKKTMTEPTIQSRKGNSKKPMAAPRKSTVTGKRKLDGATVPAAKRASANISTYFLPTRTTRLSSDLKLMNSLYKDPVELLQHLTTLSTEADPGSDDHQQYLDMLGKLVVPYFITCFVVIITV